MQSQRLVESREQQRPLVLAVLDHVLLHFQRRDPLAIVVAFVKRQHNQIGPLLDRSLVQTGVRYVVAETGHKFVGVHLALDHLIALIQQHVVDVVLLGAEHCQVLLLVASVFAVLYTSDQLLIDQIGGHLVFGWIVPRREDLFSVEQTPWCITLLSALLFGILLALADRVHHVLSARAQ